MYKKNNTRGQSLFEVLFAIAVIGILITGIVSLSAKSVRNSDYSQSNALATKFAQEAMEWIRKYRDTNWDDFISHSSASGARWCINSLPNPPAWSLGTSCGNNKIIGTPFTRELIMSTDSVNPQIVNVTVEVKWDDSSGTHTVKSISSLSKWSV
jgi:Tfp pilus assembly protein PilV